MHSERILWHALADEEYHQVFVAVDIFTALKSHRIKFNSCYLLDVFLTPIPNFLMVLRPILKSVLNNLIRILNII
jgi:hypothetical protein